MTIGNDEIKWSAVMAALRGRACDQNIPSRSLRFFFFVRCQTTPG